MRRTRAVFCVALGLLIGVGAAAPAIAAPPTITGSSITAPSDGAELFYDGDSGSGNMTVRGTVAGAGAGSQADLRCYSAADTTSTRLVSAIDVSSGSFAVNLSLSSIAGFACRLRLVPVGQSPTGSAAAPFTGPRIVVNDRFSLSSTGALYGYDIISGPLQSSFEFMSLGACPIFRSFETDPATLGSFQLFAGNACLAEQSGIAPNLHSRSALEVDGLNAYPPAAIAPPAGKTSPNLTGVPGFQPLQYTATFDPTHDTVTISESETPMICNPQESFPPSPASCPALAGSGISVTQTTTLLPGGQVARVSQHFQNVDVRSHTLDLLFGQSVISPSPGEVPGFEFPGQQLFAAHAAPDSFTEFGPGPGSIIAIGDSAAPPSGANPIGAITFSGPPQSADFISSSNNQTVAFTMHYVAALRPGASVTYDWSFSQSTSAAGLSSLEQVERDRFSQPSISITRPRARSVSHSARLTVRGLVSDPVGLKSVTVDGQPAPLRAGGTYSTMVRLKTGRQRIVAVATNIAGNTQHASVLVTYKTLPCRVPKLRGATLAKARTKLRRAGCTPGKVVRVRSRTVRRGDVVSTRPKAGSREKPFATVRLFVSRGA
jgi:Glucodextranase, domain B/PASTA domain